MRINWFSNGPFSPSGYGNQTKIFVPRIHELGHPMSVTAYYGLDSGHILTWGEIPIYPKGRGNGLDCTVIPANAQHFKADLVISLLDIWAVPPNASGNFPLCPWFPIDHEPVPPPIVRSLQKALMPIVFSKFGVRMMQEAGLDHRYVPHGYETKDYYPTDRAEARKKFAVPDGAFVVGMVAANLGSPSRKALKQQIEAFAMLHRKHSDAILFLHTDILAAGRGENLAEFVEQLGLPAGTVRFSDQYLYSLGFPEEYMRDLYNSFDVLTNVSMGEGFGLTILEAAACGTPAILGDWTSMSELCFAGWLVDKSGAVRWHTPLASYQWWPTPQAIFEQMEAAYLASDHDERRTKTAEAAVQYSADFVTLSYWKPVLEEIEDMIAANKPKSFEEYVNAKA